MTASFISAYTAWAVAVLLLSLRIGAALLLTPILAAAEVPTTVRVLLILGLSASLTLGWNAASTDQSFFAALPDHPGKLVQAAAFEAALGITLAAAIHVAFAAFVVAGRLLDIQIGFGLSQVFDPAFNSSQPILSTIFNRVGVLVFFLVNGHHALMRAVSFSIERFPVGRAWPIDAALGPTLKLVGGMFTLSVALAAPVILCIVMTELALAILARNLPQMNMLTMGVPIKIVVGGVALSLWFTSIGAVADRVYGAIYFTWNAILVSRSPSALLALEAC